MTLEHVNSIALRQDLRDLARRSRELKALLRQRWSLPMGDTQRELLCVQWRTTRLLVLRAYLRGKHHLQRHPQRWSVPGSDRYYEPMGNGFFKIRTWDAEDFHRRVAEAEAAGYPLQHPAAAPIAREEAS